MKHFCRFITGLLLLVVYSASAEVSYQIRISQPQHHLADVEMTMPVDAVGPLAVHLPAWRSGKYQILDLANGVRRFAVVDTNGKALTFKKTEKSTWQIDVKDKGTITIRYQIYANQLDSRTRHIDDTHGYLNPSAVLMYSESTRLQPVTVQLSVPAGWRSTSGMAKGAKPHSFTAANYDVLADSPIETGIHQSFQFKVDGRDYEVVIWGDGNYDAKQIVADLEKLAGQTSSIWQGYPYQNYLFIIHSAVAARGATEHLNSTVIQRDRFSFKTRQHYLDFLSTASHELVHTWNVKAYRPAELVPYDYLNPNYTKLLWISEGSTSYFQNQLLLRAGLMTSKEFYADLAKSLDKFDRLAGKTEQSVAESSFDSWISLGGDHGDNFSVNIYSEGYLVSWMLDHWLLDKSQYRASYRSLHAELFKKFSKSTAFTDQDVRNIAQQLTGKSLDAWWQQQVETPLEFNSEELLASAGLVRTAPEKMLAFSGITSTFKDGIAKVNKVERDSPAWLAGLTSEDEIVAVNKLQLKSALTDRLKDFAPKERIIISYFRNGRLLDAELTLASLPDGPSIIKAMPNASKAQKAFHQAWLGVEHDLPKP